MFTFYLNNLDRSMSRSLRFGRLISHEFLIYTSLQKIAIYHPTAGFKHSANVLGPLVSSA